MVIHLAKYVKFCASKEDGVIAHKIIKSALNEHDTVRLSFSGIAGVSSSFVNVALVSFLDVMSFAELQRRVKITNIAPQGVDVIKLCFANAAIEYKAA